MRIEHDHNSSRMTANEFGGCAAFWQKLALAMLLIVSAASAAVGDDDVLPGQPWIDALKNVRLSASVADESAGVSCAVLAPDDPGEYEPLALLASGLRPMPYMPHRLQAAGGGDSSALQGVGDGNRLEGIYPADWVNPVSHVREAGHLLEEVEISLHSEHREVRLEQFLHLAAPHWARQLLIEYQPHDDEQQAGLFIRPHKPFVVGAVPLVNMQIDTPNPELGQRTPIQDLAYRQAVYRSDNPKLAGEKQYVLITRDMDPAPAGRDWYVALAQMASDAPLAGTLRVWASGSNYRPPMAIRLYYTVAEEEEQFGFFEPTPREPDSNPGRTVGEAKRWLLWRAVEHLVDELDFEAPFPIHVVASSFVEPPPHKPNLLGQGGGSASGLWIHPRALAPGRIRARQPGVVQTIGEGEHAREHRRLSFMPGPALEREMGTDACRASAGTEWGVGSPRNCEHVQSFDVPVGGTTGIIRFRVQHPRRPFDLSFDPEGEGRMTRYFNLLRHELGHVLAFFPAVLDTHAYMASFDPPRLALDRPYEATWDAEEYQGTWINTETRRHFYGPITSTSPRNPWAGTHEPGARLADAFRDRSHLSLHNYDELAGWPKDREVMQQQGSNSISFGVSKDILADLGYARGTRAVQDRLLPRHWYDPARSGHGIDFRRVEHEDGSMTHFLHFYTYDESGQPRWYMASGTVDRQAVFEARLERVTWNEERSPQAQIDPDSSGRIRLDLDPSLDNPVCAQRREDHPDEWLHAVFEWELAGESGAWCVVPLEFGQLPAFPHEGSGSWYAADSDDSGWGLSVMTRNHGPRPIVNTVVYYYDAEGQPTWALGVAGADRMLPYRSLGEGLEIEMTRFEGFCRSCEPINPVAVPAGQMRIRIEGQADSRANRIESLELERPGGGKWQRSDIGIRLLSSPHPDMHQ